MEVTEELDDISSAAAGEAQCREAVSQVLPESIPVPAFEALVPADQWRWSNRHGQRRVVERVGGGKGGGSG